MMWSCVLISIGYLLRKSNASDRLCVVPCQAQRMDEVSIESTRPVDRVSACCASLAPRIDMASFRPTPHHDQHAGRAMTTPAAPASRPAQGASRQRQLLAVLALGGVCLSTLASAFFVAPPPLPSHAAQQHGRLQQQRGYACRLTCVCGMAFHPCGPTSPVSRPIDAPKTGPMNRLLHQMHAGRCRRGRCAPRAWPWP